MDPPDITPNGIANSAEECTSRDFLKRSGMSFDEKELPANLLVERALRRKVPVQYVDTTYMHTQGVQMTHLSIIRSVVVPLSIFVTGLLAGASHCLALPSAGSFEDRHGRYDS
jgi:hypothetical protein